MFAIDDLLLYHVKQWNKYEQKRIKMMLQY